MVIGTITAGTGQTQTPPTAIPMTKPSTIMTMDSGPTELPRRNRLRNGVFGGTSALPHCGHTNRASAGTRTMWPDAANEQNISFMQRPGKVAMKAPPVTRIQAANWSASRNERRTRAGS